MKSAILLVGSMLLVATWSNGQACDPENDIYTVTGENAVCTEVVDNVRNFYSNNYPDHTDSYNSNFTVTESDIEHSMCAYPEENGSFTPLYEETETDKGCNYTYQFGIALNGIGFTPNSNEYFENTEDGSNNIEWHVEARYLFNGKFGNNGGHINAFGSYHYHDIPVDYYTDELGITIAAHSSIVGYAADGFPIYYKFVYSDEEDATSAIVGLSSGYSLKSGSRPGDGVSAPDGDYTGLYYEDYEYSTTTLDECNGRYGVTPDFPYGTYYYVLTDNYPYMPRCFKGTVLDNTFRSLSGCPESTAGDDCALEVTGCMDPFSNNYNASANSDDGSCSYNITWDGETSTDWLTATNWDGDALPSTLDAVIIPDVDNAPVITASVIINGLTLDANANLSISSSSLSVTGALVINGSLIVESGASLLPLGEVSGNGSSTIYRNTTFGADEGNYSVIGSPVSVNYTPSLGDVIYSYDETVAYGDDGSNRFLKVENPTLMNPGDAYFSAFTGDILFDGLPNFGDLSINLIYDETNDGGATNAGFNLVSNPYSAAISYEDFVAANNDIDGALYLWDDGGSEDGQRTNSDYITVTGMGSVSAGSTSTRGADWDGFIRSTQGFFVKATTAGSLSFTPDMMTTSNNTDAGYFRQSTPILRVTMSTSKVSQDLLIGFSEDATPSFDRSLDAYKVRGNSSIQFYSRLEDRQMAIQALPLLEEEKSVALGFDVLESNDYQLSISGSGHFESDILLQDHLLNKEVLLSDMEGYSFSSEESVDSDRFSLVFAPNNTLTLPVDPEMNDWFVYVEGNKLYLKSNAMISEATVMIYDLGGHIIKQFNGVSISSDEWALDFQPKGMFVMAVQYDKGLLIKKFIK